MKPSSFAIGSANDTKPPVTRIARAPPTRIVRTSVAGAGIGNDALGEAAADRVLVEAGQQGDPLAERRLEVELSLHGALGDLGNLALEAGEIGKLVEAFLADDRRIHVRDQQALEAVLLGLNEDVDVLKPIERPAYRLKVTGHAEVDGVAFVDPAFERGLGIDLTQQTKRAVDQPVIEPSGCYQRRNGHRGRKSSSRS